MGWMAEARRTMQQRYGAYCQKMRAQGKEPLPYYKWQAELGHRAPVRR